MICLSPAFKRWYILSTNFHAFCEGCLGAEHASSQALAPQASFPSCRLLLLEEKKCRMTMFAPLKDCFQLSVSHPLDKALDFFNARQDSDVSASDNDSVSSLTSLSEAGESELDLQQRNGCSVVLCIPLSATTPLPVIGPLVSGLLDIIQKVVRVKCLVVPEPLALLPPDELTRKFAALLSSLQGPVWPRFPAVTTYMSGAAADVQKGKAPVSTFVPITKVEGLTDKGFPLDPPLELSLISVLWVRAALHVG